MRSRTVRFLLALVAALSLAGCFQPKPTPRPDLPTPTAAPPTVPTETAAPPPPTAAPARAPAPVYQPQLLFSADEIDLAPVVWSPDGVWMPFWATAIQHGTASDDPNFPVIPVFLNVRTGEVCTHPDLAGHLLDAPDVTRFAGWEADGQATVIGGGRWFRGEPCAAFQAIAPGRGAEEVQRQVSPDGRFVAVTVRGEEGDAFETGITDSETGEVVAGAGWQGTLMGNEDGWVADDLYLVTESADRGPLLLDTSGGVIEVLPELFAIESAVARRGELVAYGAAEQATGNLHLLLEDRGQEGAPLLLYHGESDEVELIPFGGVWSILSGGRVLAGFSPGGGWLTLKQPFGSPDEDAVLWVRAVDGQRTTVFAAPDNLVLISGTDDTQLALPRASGVGQVDVLAFPGGEVRQQWRFEGYSLVPWAWSPDGTKLVVFGERRPVWPDELESGPQALFLADVANPPQR